MPRPAELLLQSLKISSPKEIDVEGIANHVSATVIDGYLSDCEASITGVDDKAIIRVSNDTTVERRRFSISHELGHWEHHKGKSFKCRGDDICSPSKPLTDPERVADEYASDLLMPSFLFSPRANTYCNTAFKVVEDLKTEFQTSLLATALRLAKLGPDDVILVCYGENGRRWFYRKPPIENKWFPSEQLDDESYAYDILRGDSKHAYKRFKMMADTWFDFDDANEYEVYEESIIYGDGILTFITLP